MPEALRGIYRIDRAAPITGAVRTDAGFLRVRANLARTGLLEYVNDDGTPRRELLLASEAFRADSIETYEDAPLVHRHPAEKFVTPQNARRLTIGHARGVHRADDGHHIAGELIIRDADAIDAVERGERQLSPGYRLDLEPVPGGKHTVTADDGLPLPVGTVVDADFYQRNRRVNHIAIEAAGRSGPTVAIRLDSAGDAVVEPADVAGSTKEQSMKTVQIEGKSYEVPDEVAAHLAKLEQPDEGADGDEVGDETTQLKARIAELEKELAAAKASKTNTDAAQGEIAALRARLDAFEKAAAEASHRVLCERAAPVLGEPLESVIKLDSATVKRRAIEKRTPGINLDGATDGFIDGAFAAAMSGVRVDASRAAADLAMGHRTDGNDPRALLAKAREDEMKRVAAAGRSA